MNPKASEFTDGYYSDIRHAIFAAVDGLKEIDDYEISGEKAINDLFLFITVAYTNDCPSNQSDELADFAIDVYGRLHDEVGDMIAEFTKADKQIYLKDIRYALNENSQTGKFCFADLKGLVLCSVNLCAVSDKSAVKSLVGALARFTYLLISTEGGPNLAGTKFYENLKNVLTLDLDSRKIEHHMNGLTGEKNSDESHSAASSKTSIDGLVQEINSLIGLESIKAEVAELINMLRVQQMRLAAGLPKPDTTNHMVFYGNPGTGKTTIARKLGDIYKTLHLLSKGHFVETDRAGLVAGWLGQTALKTTEVLESAKGGILFIDEAYTLSPPNDQDLFGQEAIDTLLKYMEDNRDDIVIIVAGYQDRMERFISSNPGLKSRFGKYFHFPDYDAKELGAIFQEIAEKSQYKFGTGFQAKLGDFCEKIVAGKDQNFGNGRVMRNLFDRCITNHANRVIQIQNATSSQLMELQPNDIGEEDLLTVMQ